MCADGCVMGGGAAGTSLLVIELRHWGELPPRSETGWKDELEINLTVSVRVLFAIFFQLCIDLLTFLDR
jgi:hypothetical protein